MPPEFLAIEARGLAGAADGDVVLGDPSDRRLGPDDAGGLDGDGPDPNWNVGWVKPQGPALVGRRPPELHLDARRVTTDRDGSYPRAEPVDEGVKLHGACAQELGGWTGTVPVQAFRPRPQEGPQICGTILIYRKRF
jgi:hypothetical protein